ncbi:hypothetical protein AFLA_003247 [Aspergillus flavus NRRL3357]|nr:hypothetical protein AFLA_003247 [Aspergillus flavus NRRL3357]
MKHQSVTVQSVSRNTIPRIWPPSLLISDHNGHRRIPLKSGGADSRQPSWSRSICRPGIDIIPLLQGLGAWGLG